MQGVDDDFDWKLASTSGTANTGPLQDHTGNTGADGRFLWADSYNGGGGQKAAIATPPFNLTGDEGWLTFWYHLYGDGKLEIRVCQDGETVLAFDGDQENEWHEQNMTVSCGDNPVQITFTSTRSSSLSDVGGDDLFLYHRLPR
ncbi:enteropeptidase-like [Strongylocentrotus purpuratus]|uniref:MAM domain-containing protein n=1 Tax=Strongylocentrotus purpuratus TaxID=7668 RepID=A0A7M7NRI7_STRPU|nr:enteropeptidase-like [Strongylocentrotus purpuratus]